MLIKNLDVKDTLKAFRDFKNKQKSVWINTFWYVKAYTFWKLLTLQKMLSFFFRKLQLI